LFDKISEIKKVRAVLELEGEICSKDGSINRVREQIYRLQKHDYMDIWKEDCNCVEGMMRSKLNKSGIPRKHKKYVLDWAS
tara:strand:+ start:205 stop:447 length:243 start_codon:yes stop_codon:yes gene_type:complete